MLEGAKSIGAGAATIALAGAAIGIGNVFSSLIHSVARNPSLAKQLFEVSQWCNAVDLLGKRRIKGLLKEKLMILLILTTILLLFTSLCIQFEWLDFFNTSMTKVGVSMVSRALSYALRGWGGGIAFAILFFFQAVLTTEYAPIVGIGNQMASGDGDREITSSSSGNWQQYLDLSSDKEGDSAPEPSTARAPNQGQLQGGEACSSNPVVGPLPYPTNPGIAPELPQGAPLQHPDIAQLDQALIGDDQRFRELHERFNFYFIGRPQKDFNARLEMGVSIERHIEAALLLDGHDPARIRGRINEIRSILFVHPTRSLLLSEETMKRYLTEILTNGTRQSTPYLRLIRAIQRINLIL